MARLLLLMTSPRAGSTNFQRLLRSFEGVETFGEVFHPTGGMRGRGAAAFLDFLGVDYGRDEARAQAEVHAVLRADPVGACGALLRLAAARGAGVAEAKLFAGFMSAQVLDTILRVYRPICVRLHRTPIDAFISNEKARMIGAWNSVDTTDFRPKIHARNFRLWKWKHQNFYQMAGYLMRRNGIVPVDVSYEELYGEEGGVKRLQELLAQRSLDMGKPGRFKPMPRQDLARDRGEKVANWDAFVSDYCRRGPKSGLMAWRFDGSPAALWAQLQAERVIPRGTLRQVATKVGGALRA